MSFTGRVWRAIFPFVQCLCESTLTVTCQNCLPIHSFSGNFCCFSALKIWQIFGLMLGIFRLFLSLKGFTIWLEFFKWQCMNSTSNRYFWLYVHPAIVWLLIFLSGCPAELHRVPRGGGTHQLFWLAVYIRRSGCRQQPYRQILRRSPTGRKWN